MHKAAQPLGSQGATRGSDETDVQSCGRYFEALEPPTRAGGAKRWSGRAARA